MKGPAHLLDFLGVTWDKDLNCNAILPVDMVITIPFQYILLILLNFVFLFFYDIRKKAAFKKNKIGGGR